MLRTCARSKAPSQCPCISTFWFRLSLLGTKAPLRHKKKRSLNFPPLFLLVQRCWASTLAPKNLFHRCMWLGFPVSVMWILPNLWSSLQRSVPLCWADAHAPALLLLAINSPPLHPFSPSSLLSLWPSICSLDSSPFLYTFPTSSSLTKLCQDLRVLGLGVGGPKGPPLGTVRGKNLAFWPLACVLCSFLCSCALVYNFYAFL